MTLKHVMTFGQFKETSYNVIMQNLVFKTVCRRKRHSLLQHVRKCLKKETFPSSLKYIDVTRSTHTNLDVMQENASDDYWNVDENRSFSVLWTGFTKFTLLKEEPPEGHMWSV